jgi:hypothetical protein
MTFSVILWAPDMLSLAIALILTWYVIGVSCIYKPLGLRDGRATVRGCSRPSVLAGSSLTLCG